MPIFRFDIFTPNDFLYGFLSATLKSFLWIIERDFSHLRDALFLVIGLESASLVLDGRRGEKVIKSRCQSMERVHVQRGQISLVRLEKKPCARAAQLSGGGKSDCWPRLPFLRGCPVLSCAVSCCLWSAWVATRGARAFTPPVPPTDMQALVFFELGSFQYGTLLWN